MLTINSGLFQEKKTTQPARSFVFDIIDTEQKDFVLPTMYFCPDGYNDWTKPLTGPTTQEPITVTMTDAPTTPISASTCSVSRLESDHPGEGFNFWECTENAYSSRCTFKCSRNNQATGAVARCRHNGNKAGEWKVLRFANGGLDCNRCPDEIFSPSNPNNLELILPIAAGGYWDCNYQRLTKCTAHCKNGKNITGNAVCNRKNTKGWRKTKTKLKDLDCNLA